MANGWMPSAARVPNTNAWPGIAVGTSPDVGGILSPAAAGSGSVPGS